MDELRRLVIDMETQIWQLKIVVEDLEERIEVLEGDGE